MGISEPQLPGPSSQSTYLLRDIPAEVDAFGSHLRIAKALSQLIQEERGGRSISLEGKWGSGKSTVIRLLASDLAANGDSLVRFQVIVFDAWHHQGDPLRRTFLETLIAELQEREWVLASETWKDRKNELSGKKTDERSKTYPGFTRLGKWAAPSVLAVPVGLAFLSMSFSGNGYLLLRDILFMLGLILTGYPVIPIILWRIWRRDRKSGSSDSDDNWVGLFLSNTVTHTHTTTMISPEPTSIEFEKTFDDLMSEALSDEHRRLVLVIDNLDRVRPEDAHEIWSGLRVFLDRKQSGDRPWLDRFWLVVPYDRRGIARLWQDQTGPAPEHDQSERYEDDNAVNSASLSTIADSFLDKSFQVRFFVPSVILSNWRAFLSNLLFEAFPSSSDTDRYEVSRLVATYWKDKGPLPTPRDLKLLVNQIGVTYRIWDDEIQLPAQALYALLYRDDRNIHQLLVSGDLPLHTFSAAHRSAVIDQLAALHFSVEIDTARQLLLRSPIEAAMESQDHEQLERAARSGDGFWVVLESFVADPPVEWATRFDLIGCWARTFHQVALLRDSNRHEAHTVRRWIVQSAEQLPSISPLTEREAGHLCAVLSLEPTPQLAQTLVRKVTAPSIKEEEYVSGAATAHWASSMLAILAEMDTLGLLGQLNDLETTPPATPPDTFEVLKHLATTTDSKPYWNYFHPIDLDAVVELIEQYILTNGFHEHNGTTTVTVLDSGILSEAHRERIIDAIVNHLRDAAVITEDIQPLLATIWRFSQAHEELRPKIKELLAVLASEGVLYHYLYQTNSEDDSAGSAIVTSLLMAIAPEVAEPNHTGNSVPGYSLLLNWIDNPPVDTVRELASFHISIGGGLMDEKVGDHMLEIVHEGGTTASLVEQVLREVVNQSGSSANFSSQHVIRLWPTIREKVLGGSADTKLFVSQLVLHSQLLKSLPADTFAIDLSDLYICVLKTPHAPDNDGYGDLLLWLEDGLRSVDRNTWISSIRTRTTLYDLLMEFLGHRPTFELEGDYMAAMRVRSQEIAEGKRMPQTVAVDWDKAMNAIGSGSYRETFRNGLIDTLLDRGGEVSPDFFDIYGKELAAADELGSSPRLVRQVYVPVIETHNLPGIRWINSVLVTQDLTAFPTADIETLSDIASNEADSNESEEFRSEAQELVDRLHDFIPAIDGGSDGTSPTTAR